MADEQEGDDDDDDENTLEGLSRLVGEDRDHLGLAPVVAN